MRVNLRAGRNTSVSTGWVGAVVVLIMLAALWFYLALIIGAVVLVTAVVMGVRWLISR